MMITKVKGLLFSLRVSPVPYMSFDMTLIPEWVSSLGPKMPIVIRYVGEVWTERFEETKIPLDS